MIESTYERVWITVKYACGCVTARPIFRTPETTQIERAIGSSELCESHQLQYEREQERRREMADRAAEQRALWQVEQQRQAHHRYLIDGHLYTVIQDKAGYWRGRRRENGHTIQKHFGKTDPRPMLQEVEI